ncbi:unnamed protein product [Linum tenue]|uniref:Uncharacterized protein n=1 Tax=Linum tenue TaxID=586396 RepID=A0AAV0NKM7_9ROSI|nr:unnamed protein product [Linum tenue]
MGYNIANPTSEYTIIKIGKDEENSNSNDLPILIERNEEETPQMQEKEVSTYNGAQCNTNGHKATTMDGRTDVVDGAGSEDNQKK